MRDREFVVFSTSKDLLTVARSLIEMYGKSREYLEPWYIYEKDSEKYKKFVGANKTNVLQISKELDKFGIILDKDLIDNKFERIWKIPFMSEWEPNTVIWIVHATFLWMFHGYVCSILGTPTFANFMKYEYGIELTEDENENANQWYKYFTSNIRMIMHCGYNNDESEKVFMDLQENQDKYIFQNTGI